MTTDHRAAAERMLADADEWTAQAGELSPEASELSCLAWAAVHALLAIHDALAAPDTDGTPSATAPAPDDPADDAIDGQEGERRYLNAQTGHERTRLTAQLRQVISSVQDSGDLAELDALADAWEHHMEACLHEWAEDTRISDTTRHFICTECGITRTEERQ